MIYWDHQISWGSWNIIAASYLSGRGTVFEQCVDYCLNYSGCNAAVVTFRNYGDQYDGDTCYINYREFNSGPNCWGSTCYGNASDTRSTLRMAVFRDYYEQNPQNLPSSSPDGTVGGSYEETEGFCDETSTGFGKVNYRDMEGYSFSSGDSKNVVRESGTNCAARCFERAGCSAFYAINNGCTFIIGYAWGGEKTSGVTEAGRINALCPNTAFKSTFTRRSRFYCLFYAPSDASSIAENIVTRNTGNPDTPLRVWNFEIESNSPMITSSQYVSVEMPSTDGNYGRYRPVTFVIETHVRLGNEWSNRRRRRSDKSELIQIGELTMEEDLRIRKQAVKDAKKAAKQRQIMPRTDDILADIEAIERQATSFILEGDMELPEDVEVAATGPVETVEFVQTASDGSVAADCSSGSCECSAGFIDNGNGCEEMTTEQAATTEAPTTTQAPSNEVEDFLQSLVDKMESVFEDNRPDRPRTHLLAKWEKLRLKHNGRYKSMQNNGCEFTNTWSDDNIDFDNVNTCVVSN